MKKICCDECESTNVKEISKRLMSSHTEKESGFFGLGGSYHTRYIEHNEYARTYSCNDCNHEFVEYD